MDRTHHLLYPLSKVNLLLIRQNYKSLEKGLLHLLVKKFQELHQKTRSVTIIQELIISLKNLMILLRLSMDTRFQFDRAMTMKTREVKHQAACLL